MRYEKNIELKRKNILMFKKVMAAAVAFLIVFGIAAVDMNCAQTFGKEEQIIPQIRLVEEGKVKITNFIGEFFIEL
ncbi:MAG: hypothetical protein E7228_07225 [Clostridiales bacterium]|nr:hypothetical protein [Clostridiales bacterium]